jgi:hypothetical protein
VSELWTRSRWLLLGAVVIGLALWMASRLSATELSRDPLALAPAGASIVARVDVAAVTRSHLWSALLEQDEEGVRQIERACGYDPLEQVEEAVVFALGDGERPFEHLGFVGRGEMARGRANRERLVACVRQVVGGRGAVQEVDIEGVTALASASGGSHAAFLGSDGVVGGDREVVARAIRVAHGDEASAANDATLRRLWTRVAPGRDLVAVARVPERWVPSLRRMARELEGDLAAVGAIRALGIGVGVRDGVSLGVAAETAEASEARRVERALREQIDAVLEERLARLSAIGRVLRRVNVETNGREVVLTLSLTDRQVDEVVALWRELRRARREGDLERGAPLPDETVAPREQPQEAEADPRGPELAEPAERAEPSE